MENEKVAIITGGASGIGKAAVKMLAKRGWAVSIADRNEDDGVALAKHISDEGGRAIFNLTDVANEDSIVALVEKTLSKFSRLSGAVNCAGVMQSGKSITDMDQESWDIVNNINLRGMFLCIKHEARAMWDQREGSIVAISSAAAVKGLVNSSDYCASKAGINGLVRGAAIDCVEQNIRVNAILPGATMTPMATASTASTPKLAGTLKRPLGRMAEPEEVAAAAVWLISDEATYVTGASIAIDGGMTIA